MRWAPRTLVVLLVLATAGVASAAPSTTLDKARVIAREVERAHGLPVSAVSTTAGVATLELHDPVPQTTRSVPAANGIHFTLCAGALRRCALPALAARAQALELARRTLLETRANLVVVALPQTPTRHLQLVFERDVLVQLRGTAASLTRTRLYSMAALLPAGDKDSLLLVRSN